MKLTGTNRPITYTTHHPWQTVSKAFAPITGGTKKIRLLASTMWFPTNKPAPRVSLPREQKTQHNNMRTPQCCNHKDFPPTRSQAGRVWSKGYGGHSVGETPGPIPNPEAKTHSADGTAPGRVWESRSPPEHYSGREPLNTPC